MTLFTRDPQDESLFAIAIRRWRNLLEVSSVTLQTSRNDRPTEVGRSIAISRAIHPAQFTPIRYRQLKKIVILPEQIGLPFSPRTNDKRKPLAARRNQRSLALNRSLKKIIPLLLHAKKQLRVGRLHDIGIGCELAENGICLRQPRCQIVRRVVKCFDLVPMARLARGIAHISRHSFRLDNLRSRRRRGGLRNGNLARGRNRQQNNQNPRRVKPPHISQHP